MIMIEAKQIIASISLPFNVSSAYFHQKIVVVTGISVSVGTGGLSGNISIKPAPAFSKIYNSMPWVHNA